MYTKGSLKLKNVVVKAELFKEELKIEAKTKNGFSSEESTNCQFGSSNCQQVPSSAFPLYESEINNSEIDVLNSKYCQILKMDLKFWAIGHRPNWTVSALMEISSILLKYLTFDGSFLNIFMGKTNLELEFLYIHCSVCTKN